MSGRAAFTGLRIGLAAVKGMAFPTGALCAPVSTLEALAQGCPGGEGTVLTALDARRGQVYWAAFDLAPGTRAPAPDAAAPVTSLAAFIKNCKSLCFLLVTGPSYAIMNTVKFPACRPRPGALGHVRGAGVCLAAARMHAAGRCVCPRPLCPATTGSARPSASARSVKKQRRPLGDKNPLPWPPTTAALNSKAVRLHLEETGVPYRDFGSCTGEPCDYPDMAQAACRAVVAGECDKRCSSAAPAWASP